MPDSVLKGLMKMLGELTAKLADKIKNDWEKRGFEVFYDHGKKQENNDVGKIAIWYGEKEKSERNTELSQLDIAIAKKNANGNYEAIVLVEIEETSDRPKTLLGDIFGVLFGDYVSFNGKRLKVGDYTSLVVAGISKSKEGHAGRNQHIEDMANGVKKSLGTSNAEIGKVKIKIFEDEDRIQKDLPKFLDKMVRGDE